MPNSTCLSCTNKATAVVRREEGMVVRCIKVGLQSEGWRVEPERAESCELYLEKGRG